MNEHLKALEFYRILKIALQSCGINRVIVTMTPDGELEANVEMEKS